MSPPFGNMHSGIISYYTKEIFGKLAQTLSLQIAALTVKAPSPRMKRRVVGRFFVIRAELRDIEGFIIIRGN